MSNNNKEIPVGIFILLIISITINISSMLIVVLSNKHQYKDKVLKDSKGIYYQLEEGTFNWQYRIEKVDTIVFKTF